MWCRGFSSHQLLVKADFACPGLLDTYSAFSKIYEKPILKSRAPKCSAKDQELGRARADKVRRSSTSTRDLPSSKRSDQLGEITREFVLRRSADILSNYLPPKRESLILKRPSNGLRQAVADEYVLYIAPTTLQLAVLAKILSPKLLQTFTRGATAQCLALSTCILAMSCFAQKKGSSICSSYNSQESLQFACCKLLDCRRLDLADQDTPLATQKQRRC